MEKAVIAVKEKYSLDATDITLRTLTLALPGGNTK